MPSESIPERPYKDFKGMEGMVSGYGECYSLNDVWYLTKRLIYYLWHSKPEEN